MATPRDNQSSHGAAERRRKSASTGSDAGGAKRRKVRRACDSCKARKRKCSGDQPCPLCVSQGLICTYVSPHGRQHDSQIANTRILESSPHTVVAVPQSQWPVETLPVVKPGNAFDTNDTSRAVSPNGEGLTPAGYQGPSSTFSVSLTHASVGGRGY
jgi:hypothetical protein